MTVKSRNSEHIDLYDDVEKIKAALFNTATDVRGKASELLSDSLESVKEKSDMMQENLADYTGRKPLQTIGAAFLIGALIGFLIRK